MVEVPASDQRQNPAEKQLHLIVDNYATHKHPKIARWAAHHPRFHFHFTPTSSSWLNMVERFFRDLTQTNYGAASSPVSMRCKPPSLPTSSNTTAPPNLSSGRPKLPTCLKK
jgi:hypothetical protein